jgi:signal peptidase I
MVACMVRLLRSAARAILSCLAALLVTTLAPALFGWHSSVVLTGSMRPAIDPGDLVVASPARAADLRPGQVVVVENPARPGTLLMHRLVRRNRDGTLVTKGDANAVEDSTTVPAANVQGLARLRVPWVGRPALWLRTGDWPALIGTFAALLALSAAASAKDRGGRHRATGGARSSGPGSGRTPRIRSARPRGARHARVGRTG